MPFKEFVADLVRKTVFNTVWVGESATYYPGGNMNAGVPVKVRVRRGDPNTRRSPEPPRVNQKRGVLEMPNDAIEGRTSIGPDDKIDVKLRYDDAADTTCRVTRVLRSNFAFFVLEVSA